MRDTTRHHTELGALKARIRWLKRKERVTEAGALEAAAGLLLVLLSRWHAM